MIEYLIVMNLENIPTDSPLAFTLNPNDNIQCFGKSGRLHLISKKMLKVFNRMRYWSEFQVYPEYSFNGQSSKMGTGPRLHYHGVLRITDLDTFLELGYTELKDVCMFELDTISDPDKWSIYCRKGEKVMKPFYEKRKLPYYIDSNKIVVAQTKPTKDPIEWFPN